MEARPRAETPKLPPPLPTGKHVTRKEAANRNKRRPKSKEDDAPNRARWNLDTIVAAPHRAGAKTSTGPWPLAMSRPGSNPVRMSADPQGDPALTPCVRVVLSDLKGRSRSVCYRDLRNAHFTPCKEVSRTDRLAVCFRPFQNQGLTRRRDQAARAAFLFRLPIAARTRKTDARCGGQVLKAAQLDCE